MRFITSAALILTLASPVWAQDASKPADTSSSDIVTMGFHEDVLVTDTYDSEAVAEKVADKKFWALSAAMNSAMLLDTWSTFDVLGRCPKCREINPYVEPFVRRGPTTTFIAGQAFDVGVIMISAKLKSSKNPRLRKLWWVVPAALTTGHLIAYRHNMGVGR